LGDKKTLYPNLTETLKAAEILVKDGFKIMVYTTDDPLVAKELENIGCISVMPLAAPIGSGLGIQNKYNILSIVENAAVDGDIKKARIAAAGSGYTASRTTSAIVIRGDGSNGACEVITNGTGNVLSVEITTAGTGYTYAYVANNDIPGFDNDNQPADGTNASANIEFMISPKHGHGADPIEELGGNYVILNSRLEYAEGSGDFPTDNDFRQIGVVVNPTQVNGALMDAATAKAYKTMTFDSASFVAPTVDTFIRNANPETKASAKGVVVSVDSTLRIISYLPYPNEAGNFVAFANGNTITSATQGSGTAHGTLAASSAIAAEEVTRHSGDIIYLENRGAVSRASDQIEDIKLIVEM
jgi:hypothetical protein